MEKGQLVRFTTINDLTGQLIQLEGEVVGKAEEIKILQPDEYGGLSIEEEVYLVKREDNFGNTLHYVVFPEEVLEGGEIDDNSHSRASK